MQVNIYVDETFWQALVEATHRWPEEHRNVSNICRYAMGELHAEIHEGDLPTREAPVGQFSLPCKALAAHREEWAVLRDHYGNSATAMRVALAFLYDSIVRYEEEEDGEVEGRSAWAEYDQMTEEQLMRVSTADIRTYAACHVGVINASKIPGGKGAIVSRILEARGSGRRDSA